MINYDKQTAARAFCPLCGSECPGEICIFYPADEAELEMANHPCYLSGAAEMLAIFNEHIYGYKNSGMNMLMEQLDKITEM